MSDIGNLLPICIPKDVQLVFHVDINNFVHKMAKTKSCRKPQDVAPVIGKISNRSCIYPIKQENQFNDDNTTIYCRFWEPIQHFCSVVCVCVCDIVTGLSFYYWRSDFYGACSQWTLHDVRCSSRSDFFSNVDKTYIDLTFDIALCYRTLWRCSSLPVSLTIGSCWPCSRF